MDGLDEGGGSSRERQPWTLQMMIDNREKWNLAADVGILSYLEKFSNNLFNEAENTQRLVDSFEAELNNSCIQVSNITNRFLSLADSQFVENRVRDEEDTSKSKDSAEASDSGAKTKQEEEKVVFDRLKESVQNGLNVLQTKFEVLEVANSDSEGDDNSPTAVVYKPINSFNCRPLPHIIGSVEFMRDPTVGLEETLSDDDEESVGNSLSSESKALSEDNDSEMESDRPDISLKSNIDENNDDFSDLLCKKSVSSSFADHLAKRLEDMDTERNPVPQSHKPKRDMFQTTPPPLDDTYNDDFGSTDDLIFGSHDSRKTFDGDLFEPKSSLWNDKSDDSRKSNETVNRGKETSSDQCKKVISDFEKELSKHLQKGRTDSNVYSDILSPSPPPLDDIYDDLDGYSKNRLVKDDKKPNPSSSLFDDNSYDSSDSRSLFDSNTQSTSQLDNNSYSASKNLPTATNNIKKKLPAGAVNILSGSILKDLMDSSKTKSLNERFQGQDDNSAEISRNLSKAENITKTISKSYHRKSVDEEPTSKNATVDSSDDDEKSKSSSLNRSAKPSKPLHDDNSSVKSNRAPGLFGDVISNVNKSDIRKNKTDDIFSDLNRNADGSDEDDLFSSCVKSKSKNTFMDNPPSNANPVPSAPKISNTIDDLFGDVDNEDLFSKLNVSKPLEKKEKPDMSMNKSSRSGNVKDVMDVKDKISGNVNKKLSLFDDADDDIDVFGSTIVVSETESHKNVSPNVSVKTAAKEANVSLLSNKSKEVSSLFDDADDDLFSSSRSRGTTFGGTSNVKAEKVSTSKTDESDRVFAKAVDSEDIFSDLSKKSSTNIQNKPDIPKADKINALFSDNLEATSTSASDYPKPDDSAFSNVNKRGTKTTDKPISLFSDDDEDAVGTNDLFTKKSDVAEPKISERRSISPPKLNNPLLFNNDESKDLFKNDDGGNEVERNNLVKDGSDTDKLMEDDFYEVPPLPVVNSNDDDYDYNKEKEYDDIISSKMRPNIELFDDEASKNEELAKDLGGNKMPNLNDTSVIEHEDVFVNSESREEKSLFPNDEVTTIKSSLSADDSLFASDRILPDLPAESIDNKKPDVPVKPKPKKLEPPKSLNIREPISVLGPAPSVDSSENKSSFIKKSLDVPDGGIFSTSKSTSSDKSSSSPQMPGKLNLENIKIDPKTLLPGARPISFKKPSPLAKTSTTPEIQDTSVKTAGSTSVPDVISIENKDKELSAAALTNTEPVLHSIAKDRAKIQVKRRPQTRKARREAVRQSMYENDADETDNSSSVTTSHSAVEPKSTSSLFDQPSNILSPSTDEEDLFGVPPLDLPPDYTKVSTSPGDIFDAPNPIISPDSSNLITEKKDTSVMSDVQNGIVKPKAENSEDLFHSMTPDNSKSLTGTNNNVNYSKGESKDSFANSKVVEAVTKDLFDDLKTVDGNRKDLFPDVKISDISIEDPSIIDIRKEDSIQAAGNSKKKEENLVEKFFTPLKKNSDDLFTRESSNNDNTDFLAKESPDDDAFTSNITPVHSDKFSRSLKENIKKEEPGKADNGAAPKKPDRNLDKMHLFTEVDEIDLFSSNSISEDRKSAEPQNKESGVAKLDLTSDVLKTNNSDSRSKLTTSTVKDVDDLFPPCDWAIGSDNTKKENKNIVSVPKSTKADPLFEGNYNVDDDDKLFSTASVSKISVDKKGKHVEDLSNKTKDNTKHNKTSNVSSLFSDGDDTNLFGEIKSSKGIKQIDHETEVKQSSVKPKQSLFDDDDTADDIFGPSTNKLKNALPRESLKKSADDLFSDSRTVNESSVAGIKKPFPVGGALKKSDVSNSTKNVLLTSEKENSGKDNFIDPLSAFADSE